jgi:hypothetical protein
MRNLHDASIIVIHELKIVLVQPRVKGAKLIVIHICCLLSS